MKTQSKKIIKKADPQLSTSAKLAQIKSGEKKKRTTGGAEKKDIVTTGRDGSKIIKTQKEEKFDNLSDMG